jgi:hypothetical protein
MTFPMAFAKYLLVCMQCWSSVSRFQERTEKTETTHRTDDSRGRKQISFVLKKRGGVLTLIIGRFGCWMSQAKTTS